VHNHFAPPLFHVYPAPAQPIPDLKTGQLVRIPLACEVLWNDPKCDLIFRMERQTTKQQQQASSSALESHATQHDSTPCLANQAPGQF